MTLFYFAKTRRWREAGILGAVAIAVMLAWLWATRDLVSGNEFGSDHAGQVRFILAHPRESLAVFFRTVWNYIVTSSYLQRLVADTANGGPLPPAVYVAAGSALAVTLAHDAWWSRSAANLTTRILSLVLVCGAFFAVHLACYIYFTPVGGEIAQGNIGRYLVPMLLALTLAIGSGNSRTYAPFPGKRAIFVHVGSLAVGIGVALVTNIVSSIAIMRNYYYP